MSGYANAVTPLVSAIHAAGDDERLEDQGGTDIATPIDVHGVVMIGGATSLCQLLDADNGTIRFECGGNNAGAPFIQISPPIRVPSSTPWVTVAGATHFRVLYTPA